MELLDSRLALVAGGVALVGSERVRRVIGRGFGYAAAGTMMVGAPVVRAGRDIVEEARGVAVNDGATRKTASRAGSSGRSRAGSSGRSRAGSSGRSRAGSSGRS